MKVQTSLGKGVADIGAEKIPTECGSPMGKVGKGGGDNANVEEVARV